VQDHRKSLEKNRDRPRGHKDEAWPKTIDTEPLGFGNALYLGREKKGRRGDRAFNLRKKRKKTRNSQLINEGEVM